MGADAEIVEVIAASMLSLGISDFVIRINNRKLMNGFAASLGIPERAGDLLRIIDKMDKIGRDEVRESLKEELKLSEDQLERLFFFIELSRTQESKELFKELAPFKTLNADIASGIRDLEDLFSVLADTGIAKSAYRVDLSIARGLGYYTGIVYETNLLKLKEIGSVCSGGRYDNLTSTFSQERLPGVGSSVGVDRLIAALETLGLVENSQTPAKVLIINEDSEIMPSLHSVASKLRAMGIKVEIYPDPTKLKKQFEYSEKKGHPFLLFVEKKDSHLQYKVRNSQNRDQRIFETLEEAASMFRPCLDEKAR